MSVTVKKIGCANVKQLIEDDKLLFRDYDIINELTTFIQKSNPLKQMMGITMTW